MSGNKALRRALETSDALRVNANVPLIVDRTELITPEIAREMLKKNQRNRPINWTKVDEYAAIMKAGKWELHAQGIILDTEDEAGSISLHAVNLAEKLEAALQPETADRCWGKGAAFSLAMNHARQLVAVAP